MSFPALIAMAAILLAIGSASIRKASTVVSARHAAWSHRSERPGTAFPESELTSGMTADSATQTVSLPPGLASIAGGSTSVSAVSRNHLIINPWDDPQAGLADDAPHFSAMSRMAVSALFGQAGLDNHFQQSDASEGGGLESILTSSMDSEGSSPLAGAGDAISNALGDQDSQTPKFIQKISQELGQALLNKVDGFLGEAGGLPSINGGALRSVARAINLVVVVAGETLGVAADMIDPSQIINAIIDKLPQPAKGLAQAANVVSNSPFGKLIDVVTDVGGGVVDAVSGLFPGGGKDEESEAEKAGKKIAGLLKNLNETSNSIPRMIAQPMRNLRRAAHGLDVKNDPGGGTKFKKDMERLQAALQKITTVANELNGVLKAIGGPFD
jgi:hypothetical protein